MPDSGRHVVTDLHVRDRLWWLPGNGHGNGIEDSAWVAMLDVESGTLANELLEILGAEQIAAYAAPRPRIQSAHEPRLSGRADAASSPPVRIWVGASVRGRAEVTLIAVLPDIVTRHGRGAIR